MVPAIQILSFQDDNRVFIDMPDSPENPCLSCGACCAHFRVSFYCGELSDGSGGIVPAELTSQLTPMLVCMQGTETGGRCIALRGELGRPGIACSIYAHRPSPCREFPAWLPDGTANPDCQRLRAKHGLAPLPSPPQADTRCCKPLLAGGEVPHYSEPMC